MLSSELFYKVNSIEEEVISINGYNYVKVNVTIPGPISLIIYVGEKHVKALEAGGYYNTKKAYLTSSYEEKTIDGEFSFRIDSILPSTKEEYDAQQETTTVKFNARVGKRPKSTIKYLGPMRIPTYSVRASLKNEAGEQFHVLVVGYHSKAKVLDGLAPVTYIDVVGHISAPKKFGKSCVIVLKNHILRKEVQA